MEVEMKNMHKSFEALMVAALVVSATVSGFAQTPAVTSNTPATATTKTRQRFATKTSKDQVSGPNTSDATKRQGKRGSEQEEMKPKTGTATKPTESLDDALIS